MRAPLATPVAAVRRATCETGQPEFTELTDKERSRFLDALKDGNSIAFAAKQCGVTRQTVYNWRKADESFAIQWDDALEHGTDGLEDEAIKRAKAGSDTLLIFMLKARRKEVYAELHKQWHSGPGDKPIQTQQVDDARPPIEQFLAEFGGAAKGETKH